MSRMVRKRITIPADELQAAEEYARLDSRTFSELVTEALRQMRRRYPKTDEKTLTVRIAQLEKKVSQMYLQVHPEAQSTGGRDVSGMPHGVSARGNEARETAQ